MSTAAITSGAGTTRRQDFANFVGFKFTVGASDLTVGSLGRWKLASNALAHTVKLVDSSGVDVPGGSVTVDLSSGSVGTFVYAALASPVTLAAGASYYIASLESLAGSPDEGWYDDFTVAATSDITVVASAYYSGGWATNAAGKSYVPVNFLYDIALPPTGGSSHGRRSPGMEGGLSANMEGGLAA